MTTSGQSEHGAEHEHGHEHRTGRGRRRAGREGSGEGLNPNSHVDQEDLASTFIVQAQDQKGHTTKVATHLQPDHARLIASIVALKQFPYKTMGDLIRHAIKRHLDWLSIEGGVGISSVTRQVDAMMEVVNNQNRVSEWREVINSVSKMIADLLQAGYREQAREKAATMLGLMEGIEEGYWRDLYVREFTRRFSDLLGGSTANDYC